MVAGTTTNLNIWMAVEKPPKSALKTIKGGRLSGMTDINPQWRYRIMTEQFGLCGEGWTYDIVRLWTEPGTDGQVMAFAQVGLRIKRGEHWSEPIPGLGGSAMIAKESGGLRSSDEAYKMALTDALSVAMKMLGVGSAIYEGRFDGSKYTEEKPLKGPILPSDGAMESLSQEMRDAISEVADRIADRMNAGNTDGAIDALEDATEVLDLDDSGKIALWSLLRSDHRRAIKAAMKK